MVCVECNDDADCQSPDDVCTYGGFCAKSYVIDNYLDLTLAFVDCFNRYRGSNEVQGCGHVLMDTNLYDFDGNPATSFAKANNSETLICDDATGAYFSRSSDFDVLQDLFGCGLFDVWNIWLENDIVPVQEFCIYYAPNKEGYSLPPFNRSEVVVIERCDLSVIF
jgi:hypothetical protein